MEFFRIPALSLAVMVSLAAFAAPIAPARAQTPAATEAATGTNAPQVPSLPGTEANSYAGKAAPPIDVLPAKEAETEGIFYNINEITHPQIEMTPDKSELVRLDQDAASIIVGNPAHLNIQAESSKLLVLEPRSPGATYFTVLNGKSEIIMQRHVIVASPKEKYLRVRRSCNGTKNENCQETSVYYCPGTCHQIILADPADQAASQQPAEAAEPQNPSISVE